MTPNLLEILSHNSNLSLDTEKLEKLKQAMASIGLSEVLEKPLTEIIPSNALPNRSSGRKPGSSSKASLNSLKKYIKSFRRDLSEKDRFFVQMIMYYMFGKYFFENIVNNPNLEHLKEKHSANSIDSNNSNMNALDIFIMETTESNKQYILELLNKYKNTMQEHIFNFLDFLFDARDNSISPQTFANTLVNLKNGDSNHLNDLFLEIKKAAGLFNMRERNSNLKEKLSNDANYNANYSSTTLSKDKEISQTPPLTSSSLNTLNDNLEEELNEDLDNELDEQLDDQDDTAIYAISTMADDDNDMDDKDTLDGPADIDSEDLDDIDMDDDIQDIKENLDTLLTNLSLQ